MHGTDPGDMVAPMGQFPSYFELLDFCSIMQSENYPLVNDLKTADAVVSMTGYAVREGSAGTTSWNWELRSVNGRGMDLKLRLPDGLGILEPALRKRLSEVMTRGSITLSLRLGRDGGGSEWRLDQRAIERTLGQLSQIRAAAEGAGLEVAPISATDLLAMRNIAEAGPTQEIPAIKVLLADFEPLLSGFLMMRQAEGGMLAKIMLNHLDRVEDLVKQARVAADARAEPHAARLRNAIRAVLDIADLDEARLTQDIAAIAAKMDVTEEIDRLRAHVTAARDLLKQGGPIGRKLDFMFQEFSREANTLCSKSQDATLTAIGLDLKLAIDQMREQVQNVE